MALHVVLSLVLLGVSSVETTYLVEAFVPATHFHHPLLSTKYNTRQNEEITCRVVSRWTSNTEQASASSDQADVDDNDDNDDEDISFLFDEPPVPEKELDPTELVWRYAKKPLLRIGSKGATHSHGNSLRQLLEDHTIVKVKVNTKKFQNSVQQAYEVLKGLAIENGAPSDLELIQLREGTNEILFAMPGTLQKMEEGTFPPPPPPAVDEEADADDADNDLASQ